MAESKRGGLKKSIVGQSSNADADLEWQEELAYASQVIPPAAVSPGNIKKRAEQLRAVKAEPKSPERWITYLRTLNEDRKHHMRTYPDAQREHSRMYEALQTVYDRTRHVVPVSTATRFSPQLVQLWLDNAELRAEYDYERSNSHFKLMKNLRIGQGLSMFWNAWADLEVSVSNKDRAARFRNQAAVCEQSVATPMRNNDATPKVLASSTLRSTKRKVQLRPPRRVVNPSPAPGEGKETDTPRSSRIDATASLTSATHEISLSGQMSKTKVAEDAASAPTATPSQPHTTATAPALPPGPRISSLPTAVPPTRHAAAALAAQLPTPRITSPEVSRREKMNRHCPSPPLLSPPQEECRKEDKPAPDAVASERRAFSRDRNPSNSSEETRNRGDRSTDQHKSARGSEVERQESKLSRFFRAVKSDNFVIVHGRTYLVLELVGKGGSSQVYKVLSADMKILALKQVKVPNASRAVIDSYANEIDLLKRLRGCPTIIQLYDAEVDYRTGMIQLIMEYGGVDLAKRLGRGKEKTLNCNFQRIYWQQMLEAVHTIHEARIIHGDLKPANFLIVEGTLKLIDFGIAKAIQADDTTKILRDSQVGTPNYMSPEALMCDEEEYESGEDDNPRPRRYRVGRGSDIWSLGCILYQMVYGKAPFAHIKNTMHKLRCIQNPNYKISFPPVDPQLMDVLQGCLQRDPERRLSIPTLLGHPYSAFDASEAVRSESRSVSFVTGVDTKSFVLDFVGHLEGLGFTRPDGKNDYERAVNRMVLIMPKIVAGARASEGASVHSHQNAHNGRGLLTPTVSAMTGSGVASGAQQTLTRSPANPH